MTRFELGKRYELTCPNSPSHNITVDVVHIETYPSSGMPSDIFMKISGDASEFKDVIESSKRITDPLGLGDNVFYMPEGMIRRVYNISEIKSVDDMLEELTALITDKDDYDAFPTLMDEIPDEGLSKEQKDKLVKCVELRLDFLAEREKFLLAKKQGG